MARPGLFDEVLAAGDGGCRGRGSVFIGQRFADGVMEGRALLRGLAGAKFHSHRRAGKVVPGEMQR